LLLSPFSKFSSWQTEETGSKLHCPIMRPLPQRRNLANPSRPMKLADLAAAR